MTYLRCIVLEQERPGLRQSLSETAKPDFLFAKSEWWNDSSQKYFPGPAAVLSSSQSEASNKMGCGISAQAASEYQRMMQEVSKMRQETEEAAEDRETMEGEVHQLRRQVTELTEENEFLKERLDRLVNFEHPSIFEESKGPDELIANWIEMDLRDGDELLAALARVHPESESDVREMLEVSASIRRTESTLQQYCGYFANRFKLYNKIWAKVVGVHFVLDDSFRGMKESIAQAVQSVETIVGKKSAALDQLTKDVRELFKLKYGEFIGEYRRINGVIEGIRLEHLQKKLEEKEAERQRLWTRYESDMKAIHAKHASELQNQTDETAKMRTDLLNSLDTQAAKYTATIAHLQATHEQELKIRYDTEERMDTNYTNEKAYMKASLKAKNEELKAEFEEMMRSFMGKQTETQLQIIEKCKKTIQFYEETITNLRAAHAFELHERLSEATNCQSMCYEDIRQELIKQHTETTATIASLQENSRIETARRDLEVQELKEMHKGEMLDLIVLLRNWQSSVRVETAQELASVRCSMEAVYGQIVGKMRSDHEEYIATLVEDYTEEIAELIVSKDGQAAEQREQLNGRICVILEDVRALVHLRDSEIAQMKVDWKQAKEQEMDKRERQRAAEIGEIMGQFADVFSSVVVIETHHAAQFTKELDQFSLNILPVFDPPNFQFLKSDLFTGQNGLDLYSYTLNQLQSTLNAAKQATETTLKTQNQGLSNLSTAWLHLESLRSALQQKLEDEQVTFTSKTNDLQSQLETAANELNTKDASMFELAERVSDLAEKLNAKDEQITQLHTQLRFLTDSHYREHSQEVQKRLFTSFWKKLAQVKRSFLFKWRMRSSAKPMAEEPAPVPEESDEEDDGELEHIEQILLEEKKQMLENNVVKDAYQKVGKPEKPLSVPQVVKFFEEMMDQKYDADIRDLKNQKPLKPLPEYMLDHLTRIFGLKKLALKNLCQLMPALESMYAEQDPYHLLLCRLIQVMHPDPVPYQLGIFLTRIRVEFMPLMEKHQKDKEARDNRRNLGKKEVKGAGNPSAPQEAYLVDTIGYIYSLFENDRRSGELMLKLVQPSAIQMIDYLIFKLCHKMSKLGLNIDGLFSMLDPHSFGYIDERDFITKSRRELELWVSSEDLSNLFRSLSDGHRELNREMFCSKINYKQYLERCKSDLYVVTRQQFLICLIEVYHARQRRDGVYINSKISQDPFFTKEEVIENLRRIEPTLESDRTEELYQKALSHAENPEVGVDQKSLLKTILQNPLGLMKKSAFCKI